MPLLAAFSYFRSIYCPFLECYDRDTLITGNSDLYILNVGACFLANPRHMLRLGISG